MSLLPNPKFLPIDDAGAITELPLAFYVNVNEVVNRSIEVRPSGYEKIPVATGVTHSA